MKKTLTKTHGFVEYLCAEVRPQDEVTPDTSFFFDETAEGASDFLMDEDSTASDLSDLPWRSP